MYSEDKFLAIVGCKSVENIFSNPIIDPNEDYYDIVSSAFIDPPVKEGFIREMINRGNANTIIENLSALRLDHNWQFAQAIPEFREMLLQNMDKALDNEDTISPETIKEMHKYTGDNKIFIDNLEKFTERSHDSLWPRKELIEVLSTTDEGKNIVDSNLSSLVYGNYPYAIFVRGLLRENLFSKEQIASLIIQEPARMLEENLKTEYYSSPYDMTELLDIIDETITTTPTVQENQITDVRDAIEEFIVDHFDELIEKTKVDNLARPSDKYSIKMLKVFKQWDTDKHRINDKFAENYEKISNGIHESETMDMLHLYSDIDVGTKPDIDLETIMNQTFSYIRDPNVQWAISKIASELLEDQHLEPNQMEVYGSGNYSRSVKIGDYIFKVGEERSTPSIPFDERIIQPLIRRELEGDNDEKVYIEVQNLVDKDWYKGLTEDEIKEELYTIYSEMRDRGHRWTDVRKENVGRLQQENSGLYHINGQELKGFDSAIGFREVPSENREQGLSAGELVIIDTDFIYGQEQSYHYSNVSIHRELEERYQRERAARMKMKSNPKDVLSAMIDKTKDISQSDMQTMANTVVVKAKDKEQIEQNSISTDDEDRRVQ